MASSACSPPSGAPSGVLRLRLDRPERRNALDGPLVERLLAAVSGVQADGPVRALLIVGEGPAFCAGADLTWMRDAGRAPWEENLATALRLADLLAAIDACPVPTVARVHGVAYGGGVGLLAAVDVAVAASDAHFAFSEAKLGLLPAVIAPYVLPKIGEGAARALFVTGERFNAERALRLGLVHAVAPPEELDGAVDTVLRELATAAPGTALGARALLRRLRGQALDADDVRRETAEGLARLRAAPLGQEGLTAALEKRPPSWVTGRGSPSSPWRPPGRSTGGEREG